MLAHEDDDLVRQCHVAQPTYKMLTCGRDVIVGVISVSHVTLFGWKVNVKNQTRCTFLTRCVNFFNGAKLKLFLQELNWIKSVFAGPNIYLSFFIWILYATKRNVRKRNNNTNRPVVYCYSCFCLGKKFVLNNSSLFIFFYFKMLSWRNLSKIKENEKF